MGKSKERILPLSSPEYDPALTIRRHMDGVVEEALEEWGAAWSEEKEEALIAAAEGRLHELITVYEREARDKGIEALNYRRLAAAALNELAALDETRPEAGHAHPRLRGPRLTVVKNNKGRAGNTAHRPEGRIQGMKGA